MKSELHVPSDLKFLTIVENWLLGCLQAELGESFDWSHQSNRLRLVLVEAYSNVVRLELRKEDITLEIWDRGEGFDMSSYSPPTPSEKQEGGYGWLIMNRLMDKVEYDLEVDGGNCLKLEVSLPAAI